MRVEFIVGEDLFDGGHGCGGCELKLLVEVRLVCGGGVVWRGNLRFSLMFCLSFGLLESTSAVVFESALL